jgi:hypothetical protein
MTLQTPVKSARDTSFHLASGGFRSRCSLDPRLHSTAPAGAKAKSTGTLDIVMEMERRSKGT